MTHRPAHRHSDNVVVRPSRTVPMTAQQRRDAVQALAALLLARWADQPRPAAPTGRVTGQQPPHRAPTGRVTGGQPGGDRAARDAGGGLGKVI